MPINSIHSFTPARRPIWPSLSVILVLALFGAAANAQSGSSVPPSEPLGPGVMIADCQTADTAPWTEESPVVVINYGKLQNLFGSSNTDLERLERDTILAIERWKAAGLPFDVTYGGLSAPNQTSSGPGEILITAASHSTGINRPAGATSLDSAMIQFMRYSQDNNGLNPVAGPPYQWSTGRTEPSTGRLSYFSILVHELGHTFGICQHDGTSVRTAMPSVWDWRMVTYGPYAVDIDRVRTAHSGMKRETRVRPWSSPTTNLASWFMHSPINTTQLDVYDRLGVVKDPGYGSFSPKSVLTYTQHRGGLLHPHPGWLTSGDGDFGVKSHWRFTGLKSWFGTAVDGEDGEYMWAYVDHVSTPGENKVRVLYTSSGANSGGAWSHRDLPGYTDAVGTPAVAHLYGDTWMVAYATFNAGSPDAQAGALVYHLTTDSGATWSSQYVANTFYDAFGDVSIAVDQQSSQKATAFVSFVWDRHSVSSPISGADYRRVLRTLVFDVENGVVSSHPQYPVVYGADSPIQGGSLSHRNDKTARVHTNSDGEVLLQLFSSINGTWTTANAVGGATTLTEPEITAAEEPAPGTVYMYLTEED